MVQIESQSISWSRALSRGIVGWIFILAVGGVARAEGGDLPFGALAPFATDGCTGFTGGPRSQPRVWEHCCVRHDVRYWRGGSFAERVVADRELAMCVAATGHGMIARMMYAAVRVGGDPMLATPWRWGFGWQRLRGYASLSAAEEEEVRRRTGDQAESR